MKAFLAAVILALLPMSAFPASLSIGLVYSAKQWRSFQTHKKDPLASYARLISRAGGQVVRLHELTSDLTTIHGIIFPGGGDIDPELYDEHLGNQDKGVNRAFDQFEMDLLQMAEQHGIPVLGICRGMQLINVYRGGSLYQDVAAELRAPATVVHRIRRNGKSQPCHHPVRLVSETWASEQFKKDELRVNSYHHQGVKKLGRDLRILAYSDDGLVEAFESVTGPYMLAVQFHLEKASRTNPDAWPWVERFFMAARVRDQSNR